METRSASRTIAVLILLQLAAAPVVNFALLAPVFAAPGFLHNAAAHATNVSLAVLLGLVTTALSLGMAIAAQPVLRRRGEAAGYWLLALATAGLALNAVEQAHILSLLSLSQARAAAGPADAALFETLRGVVGSARNWAHYTGLLVMGAFYATLFATLFRHALVPRALAGFGVLAALSQMTAVAMPIFGTRVVFALLAPAGLALLALAAWLLAKGFRTTAESAAA